MIKCRRELERIQPYVPGKHIDAVKEEYGITDVVKLASNENPLGMGRAAAEAIAANLENVHLYPDGSCALLREKLASRLGVASGQIIVGNGSDEILKMVAEAYLTESDAVIMADPTFSEYRFAADMMGAEIRAVPLVDFRHDLAAMAAQIDEKTKIIFVCNPNNPTGTIVNRAELEQLLNQVPRHILVLVDEAYYEYVSSREYPQTIGLIQQYPNLMVTRTFSKVHGLAGLRIGYAVADFSVIRTLERVKEPFNVNLLAQAAACASLDDQDHLKRSIENNEAGKRYLYEQFDLLKLKAVPTEANFILVDLNCEARDVFQKLLAKGVIVRPADAFGLPSFIRVTVGTMEQNRRFIQALREVLYADRD